MGPREVGPKPHVEGTPHLEAGVGPGKAHTVVEMGDAFHAESAEGLPPEYHAAVKAARTGDLPALKGLIEGGLDVNATGPREGGLRLVNHAAMAGKPEILEYLIQQGGVDAPEFQEKGLFNPEQKKILEFLGGTLAYGVALTATLLLATTPVGWVLGLGAAITIMIATQINIFRRSGVADDNKLKHPDQSLLYNLLNGDFKDDAIPSQLREVLLRQMKENPDAFKAIDKRDPAVQHALQMKGRGALVWGPSFKG